MRIKSIKKKPPTKQIDITTEKNHNFFANGILTHNCNLPARNVVIVGVHRGMSEVDELDIIQMAGRAGRYGIDDEGHVFMVIPEGSSNAWQYTFANPRPVTSVLNSHGILAFHVLAEIETKAIKGDKDLFAWYSRSLASRQDMKFDKVDASALMEDLAEMEMTEIYEGHPRVTGLGRVSAWMYYNPYDVAGWHKNFCQLFGRPVQGEKQESFIDLDDITLAWAIGDIPSNDPGYITRDLQPECDDFLWHLKNRGCQVKNQNSIPAILAAYNCLTDGEAGNGTVKAISRNLIFDVNRICQSFSMVDGFYEKWGKDDFWKSLPIRIKYAVSEEVVPLCQLKGIGGARAKKMFERGIKSLEDVAATKNKRTLLRIMTPMLVKQIQEQATNLI